MIAGTNAHGNCATRESGRILSYKEIREQLVLTNSQHENTQEREINRRYLEERHNHKNELRNFAR